MAITVDYSPAASQYGGIAYRGGRGRYETTERRYQDKLRLAVEQLLQRERMQQTEIAASAQARADEIAASERAGARQLFGTLAGQAMQQDGRERLASFGALTDAAAREQQAGLQAELQQQQYGLLGERDEAQFGRDLTLQEQQALLQRDAEQARLDDRLGFARREYEQRQARIDEDAERRVTALRGQIGTGLREQDAERRIAQIYGDAERAKAELSGLNTDIGALGPTPQERLAFEFESEVYIDPDGRRWVRNADGTWQVARGFKLPDEDATAAAEATAKADADRLKGQAERSKTYRDLLSGFMRETVEGDDGRQTQRYTAEQAAEMVADVMRRADRFAFGPPWQGPVQPGQGYPLPGGYAPYGEPFAPGTGLTAPIGAAAPGAAQAAQSPDAVPGHGELEPAGKGSPEQIPQAPVRNYYAIRDRFGGIAPEDLTPTELRSIGGHGLSHIRSDDLPKGTASEIGDLRGMAARHVREPNGRDAAAARALQLYTGAVLAYGPDPMAWPAEVRAGMLEEARLVYEMKRRGSANGGQR